VSFRWCPCRNRVSLCLPPLALPPLLAAKQHRIRELRRLALAASVAGSVEWPRDDARALGLLLEVLRNTVTTPVAGGEAEGSVAGDTKSKGADVAPQTVDPEPGEASEVEAAGGDDANEAEEWAKEWWSNEDQAETGKEGKSEEEEGEKVKEQGDNTEDTAEYGGTEATSGTAKESDTTVAMPSDSNECARLPGVVSAFMARTVCTWTLRLSLEHITSQVHLACHPEHALYGIVLRFALSSPFLSTRRVRICSSRAHFIHDDRQFQAPLARYLLAEVGLRAHQAQPWALYMLAASLITPEVCTLLPWPQVSCLPRLIGPPPIPSGTLLRDNHDTCADTRSHPRDTPGCPRGLCEGFSPVPRLLSLQVLLSAARLPVAALDLVTRLALLPWLDALFMGLAAPASSDASRVRSTLLALLLAVVRSLQRATTGNCHVQQSRLALADCADLFHSLEREQSISSLSPNDGETFIMRELSTLLQ